MPKADDKKPASAAAPQLVHYWTAQCVRCNRVGNMKAATLPEGMVGECCLQPAEAPKAEPAKE